MRSLVLLALVGSLIAASVLPIRAQQPIANDDPSLPALRGRDVEAFVPLPDDLTARLAPSSAFGAQFQPFGGVFAGAFSDHIRAVIAVERMASPDTVSVVYGVADSLHHGIFGAWQRREGRLIDGQLVVDLLSAKIVLSSVGINAVDATYVTRSGHETAGYFTRLPREAVRAPLILTDIVLPGETVRIPLRSAADQAAKYSLEARVFKPQGAGPFPLAVFHHGSDIGLGALKSYSAYAHARWLVGKGYLVVVPMRRGRGLSDGVSLEGRYKHDNTGAITDVTESVEAGLSDLDAVMAYTLTRDDIARVPALLVGQSRGGFLSVVHAGRNPDAVAGVINFVGGWLGGSPSMEALNTPYFADAGRSTQGKVPQLWIYGERDSFYGEAHVRANHAAFEAAGGRALFHFVRGFTGNGHFVQNFPKRWRSEADAFLATLKSP